MPRNARNIESNSYYHILTRGNDRKKLFRCAGDYKYFLKLIRETLERHKVTIYHYCLMNNHVHFLIKALRPEDVPGFFKILLQRYAHYFRRRYNHTGFLFQNRYKSYLIDKESYLLECARYIERNPVRAGIVQDPGDYIWSSYLCYASDKDSGIISEPDPIYLELSGEGAYRKLRYKNYILGERPYELLVDKGLGIG